MKKICIVVCVFYSMLSYCQTTGILSSDANVRRNPAGQKLKVINKGKKVRILDSKKGWSFIEDISNSKKGWVSSKLILTNIITINKDANVRRSPGGEKIKIISKGKQVLVLLEKNNWRFIKDISNNKKGWVHQSVLSSTLTKENINKVTTRKTTNSSVEKVNNKILKTNNSTSSAEQIIESRLRKMNKLQSWAEFKRLKNKRIYINDINKFINTAKDFIGAPYGKNNNWSGIDCSGLIYRGLQSVGVKSARLNAQNYAASGKLIANKSSLKPGDLVCFSHPGTRTLVNHISIYLGNDKFLHSPNWGKKVKKDDINDPYYWGDRFIFGVRYE